MNKRFAVADARYQQDDVDDSYTHIVLLLHGIRTRAFWYDTAKPILSEIDNVVVRPLGYGYFNIFGFLFPFFFRRRPQKKVIDEIRNIKWEFENKKEDIKLSVIAHSFGTYTILSILEKENDLDLENLILCGSVIPVGYDFGDIARKVKRFRVNDVGVRDIFPVAAKIFSFGYGDAGTFGFYSGLCEDRFHNFKHSDFFSEQFIRDYWRPIFAESHVEPSNFSRSQQTPARTINWLSLLPRGFFPSVLIVALALWLIGAYRAELGRSVCSFWPSSALCTAPVKNCLQAANFFECYSGDR